MAKQLTVKQVIELAKKRNVPRLARRVITGDIRAPACRMETDCEYADRARQALNLNENTLHARILSTAIR